MMISTALIVLFFLIGLWAVLWKRNLVKKIIGLGFINSAVVMLFVYSAAEDADTAPILYGGVSGVVADPLPQALMLTAIVIGVSLTALALGLSYRLYEKYGTLDIREIERKAKGDE